MAQAYFTAFVALEGKGRHSIYPSIAELMDDVGLLI